MGNNANLQIDLRPLTGLDLNLDQYCGLWAVEEVRFLQMVERIARLDLAAHVAARQPAIAAAAKIAPADNRQTVAVIDITGTMTKRGSSLSDAGATILLRRAVRQAADDEAIDAIVLRIDSPGGTVAGTADLAREVAAAGRRKPVWAFVEDLAASAAYWVASQAARIVANDRTAMIGSIGTYVGLYDYSAAAGQQGIRPVVIRAGKYKGAGFPGTEITHEQQAVWQKLIDKTQAEFSAGVAAGRKMPISRVDELADGRVHMAADAQSLGLIDAVMPFEETIAQLLGQLGAGKTESNTKTSSPPSKRGETQVSETTTTTPPPATLEDLKICCPGADNDFLVGELAKKATVDQAQSAWMEEQNARLAAAEKKAAEAEQKAAEVDKKANAAKTAAGVDPLSAAGAAGDDSGDTADAVEQFNLLVRENIKAGMSRRAAIQAAARAHPYEHTAYLAAVNPNRQKIQDLIQDRHSLARLVE